MTNRIVELKERVYEYVSHRGPVLPATVAKEFHSTNLFMSALLSELVTNKRLKLTKAKIGGSPLYYCAQQEERLPQLLRGHLGQKPREALDLLMEKKVLRDRDCLPYERVALRELIDFAIPVRLVIQDTEELFWKFSLVKDAEAKDLIEQILQSVYAPSVPADKGPGLDTAVEVIAKAAQPAKTKNDDVQETLVVPKKRGRKKKVPPQEKLVDVEESKKKITVTMPEKEDEESDDFEEMVVQYLKKKGIKVQERIPLKRNREINFIVHVPSNAGDLPFFVKARNRRTLSEGDLLLAFTEGQNLKLPLLYISNAEISKKAQAYISKNIPGMLYLRLK